MLVVLVERSRAMGLGRRGGNARGGERKTAAWKLKSVSQAAVRAETAMKVL